MAKLPVEKETVQLVCATCLTIGEFVVSIWLAIAHSHYLALYLAITYATRETPGGRHYQHVMIAAIKAALPRNGVRHE